MSKIQFTKVKFPQEFATLTKELNQSREQVLEKDEEITELKAERNNTRLLLEHLECLVSRHERSLRMTVVKRQAAAQSGVSSEVEVLKALKSLFEHHKALDEKVRERLRVALEKNAALEEDLEKAKNNELLQEEPEQDKENNSSDQSESNNSSVAAAAVKKKVNGNVDPEVHELRKQIEKHSSDLGSAHRTMGDLRTAKGDLEDQITSLNKELHSAQELIKRLEIELKENVAQKEDQEERIATLEKRYLNSQREATMLHDLNEKLEQELKNKEEQYMLSHDKIKAITEKLDISEQKLLEFASMPDIEEQLKDRMEALTQAQERQGTAEERIQRLEGQLEEKSADVLKFSQRLKMNEEHNQRLSATVDKLLSESNERLQVHLKERMHSLEEKNHLSNELERTKKKLEDAFQQKVRLDLKKFQSHFFIHSIHSILPFLGRYSERAAESPVRNRECQTANAPTGNSSQYSTDGSPHQVKTLCNTVKAAFYNACTSANMSLNVTILFAGTCPRVIATVPMKPEP